MNMLMEETPTHTDQKYRTSRGQLAESEEIVSNLLAAVEHLMDLPGRGEFDDVLVKKIRNIRLKVLKSYASDVDTNLHCAYRHLLLARTQLRELIQAKITDGKQVSDLNDTLAETEEALHEVRCSYLKVSPSELSDPDCIQCLEDYIGGREEVYTDNK